MGNTRYLTPSEVARRLGCNYDKIRTWIASGELRAVNLSNGTRPRCGVMIPGISMAIYPEAVKPC
jgi:excisionase family DNA binding protein